MKYTATGIPFCDPGIHFSIFLITLRISFLYSSSTVSGNWISVYRSSLSTTIFTGTIIRCPASSSLAAKFLILPGSGYSYDAAPQSFPYPHFANVCDPLSIFAVMKILMVCLGNICRSPLAEGILQQKVQAAGLSWRVDSAGTNGYHTGEAPHHLSQKVAKLNGIDISCQRARRFAASDFQEYDMIYALAGDVISEIRRIAGKHFDASKVQLLMDALHPGKSMDVPDPWYGPEPGYHEVYSMIDAACDQIIQQHAPFQRNQ